MHMPRTLRIGQIVPSSNTTMETEIPALFRRHAEAHAKGREFTFHSSRMRMRKVSKAELEAMDRESVRCAAELADAPVDVVGYACLVAIMSMGNGYHRQCEENLGRVLRDGGRAVPLVTSAGALVEGLKAAGMRRVSMVTPYVPTLTALVVSYLEAEGIRVIDALSLAIEDNVAVGARDPLLLLKDVERLDCEGADAVVLSACVQMPSLAAIEGVEDKLGLPVTSAAVCTARAMMLGLRMAPVVARAGYFLSPRNATGFAAAETVAD